MNISHIDDLKSYYDVRGELLPIYQSHVPFVIKRLFYISNVLKDTRRGGHAHKTTKQYLMCVSGTLDVILKTPYINETYKLTKNQGIYIPELIWDEQLFLENNTNILVLCSTDFNELDYIKNFNAFINLYNSR